MSIVNSIKDWLCCAMLAQAATLPEQALRNKADSRFLRQENLYPQLFTQQRLKDFLPQHTWYAADVDAIGKAARKYKGFQLKTIGNALQFVEYCSEIDQFIWGVFLGIDNRFLSQNIESIELGAEDEAFRPIPCDGVLIEIRTFDTAYFEIYSDDFVLMRKISEKYNVKIEETHMENEGNKFTWGNPVVIKKNAPANFHPGEFASVCGMIQAETELLNDRHEGEWFYTVEFGDGSSIEVPECYLEPYEEETL